MSVVSISVFEPCKAGREKDQKSTSFVVAKLYSLISGYNYDGYFDVDVLA